jgi:hypothetical protein
MAPLDVHPGDGTAATALGDVVVVELVLVLEQAVNMSPTAPTARPTRKPR